MELGPDLSEFVASLIANEVDFMIVGGYAVAAHGQPRATGDLDAWILVSSENSRKVMNTIADFGFDSLGLAPEDFENPDIVVQLGYPPNRIDILTSIDGVDFEQAWPNRFMMRLGDQLVAFIGREDLIKNKIASARPRDLADVVALTEEADTSEDPVNGG
jgi:hypothetical protein